VRVIVEAMVLTAGSGVGHAGGPRVCRAFCRNR
jgi:hypothetical protein